MHGQQYIDLNMCGKYKATQKKNANTPEKIYLRSFLDFSISH